jgi:hypothetical protein
VAQGNDFWGNNTNPIPRRSAPFASTTSPLRLHNGFGFLRLKTHPVDVLQAIPLDTRRLSFNFFFVRFSIRPVDAVPCRDEDVSRSHHQYLPVLDIADRQILQKYGITPPSEAEVAAAIESTSDKQADSAAQQDQAVAGARGSGVRTMQGQSSILTARAQNSGADTGESSYVIGCCGFSFRLSSAH